MTRRQLLASATLAALTLGVAYRIATRPRVIFQEPPVGETVEHPTLGPLTFNEDLEQREGRSDFGPARPFEFSLSTRTGDASRPATEEVFRRGADYLQWARRSEPDCRQKIAEELLGVYNDAWADETEGRPAMTREQFLGRLGLASIALAVDGSADWYYFDGGLFGGHLIEVRVGPDQVIFQVGLAG